jgi:hypothetical protein
VTYLSEVQDIRDYVRTRPIQEVSIWAIQRDNGGCPGGIDSNSCSGITQPRWAFSHLLDSDGGATCPVGSTTECIPNIFELSRRRSNTADDYGYLRSAVDLAHPLAVVTPTLDGDVLAALALADSSFTPGQLHRILSVHSEDGIRRVLHRLTGQGIVTSERVGHAFTYRLNRRHLAAGAIIALARLQGTLLDRIEQALAAWEFRPVYGAVFGSAARGEMRAGSDIDLLLVRPDTCDRERWDELASGLAADIAEWTGNDTQVLEFTESEVREAGTAEPVLRDVRDRGLIVAGSSAWLTRVLRRTDATRAAD